MTKDFDSARHELFEQFARIGKAVSSATRLELLDLLAQGEKPVEMLARQSGLSVTNTSNHLKELRASGLVATRREGPYVYYRARRLEVGLPDWRARGLEVVAGVEP